VYPLKWVDWIGMMATERTGVVKINPLFVDGGRDLLDGKQTLEEEEEVFLGFQQKVPQVSVTEDTDETEDLSNGDNEAEQPDTEKKTKTPEQPLNDFHRSLLGQGTRDTKKTIRVKRELRVSKSMEDVTAPASPTIEKARKFRSLRTTKHALQQHEEAAKPNRLKGFRRRESSPALLQGNTGGPLFGFFKRRFSSDAHVHVALPGTSRCACGASW